jgi:hypothetical protein
MEKGGLHVVKSHCLCMKILANDEESLKLGGKDPNN